MKKYLVLLFLTIVFISGTFAANNDMSFYNIFKITFDNTLGISKVGEEIFTYKNDENNFMVRITVNISKKDFETQMNLYLRPKKNITLDQLKIFTKIDVTDRASANFGMGDEYKFFILEKKNFDVIDAGSIKMKRVIAEWGSQFTSDILLYNFEFKNDVFDNCLIEFYNMMPDKTGVEETKNLIKKSDSKVQNYLLIENSVKSITYINKEYRKFYFSKVDNLRLRETDALDGKIIRNLVKSEKVELIKRGKKDEINNIRGHWLLVKTEKGETGWCFDGYLFEIYE